MSKNELKKLSKKFLNGTASEEEKQMLHDWYDDTTSDGYTEHINTKAPETELEVKQRILDKIKEQMLIDSIPAEDERKHTISIKRIIWQAASVAAMLVAALLIWNYNSSGPVTDKQLVSVPHNNKVIHLVLPDGSKVWLNAGSILKYPKKFEGKLRTVELLEGRAFFDIKHENDHPFIVKTQNLDITVLGTSFDVRSYQKEGNTKVSVLTGKVGITLPYAQAKPAIMLVAKQQVIVSKASNQVFKGPVHESVVNLWCKDPLVFDQKNLSDVFTALEKKYNTKIYVEDKELLNEPITITLGNQRLDTIMQILKFTKHFNYKIANDSTVVIK